MDQVHAKCLFVFVNKKERVVLLASACGQEY